MRATRSMREGDEPEKRGSVRLGTLPLERIAQTFFRFSAELLPRFGSRCSSYETF
jgi:hypothetical protein